MTLRAIQGGADAIIEPGRADYLWVDAEGRVQCKQVAIGVGKDTDGDPAPLVPRITMRDLLLSPAHVVPDPTLTQPTYMVLCEVRDLEDRCVDWNFRAKLRRAFEEGDRHGSWWGLRQSVALHNATKAQTWSIWERFFGACLDAGLLIHSQDREHFNLGPRPFRSEGDRDSTAVLVADHLIFALHLMRKVALAHGIESTPQLLTPYVSTGSMRAGLQGGHAPVVAMLAGKDAVPLRTGERGTGRCFRIPCEHERDPYKLILPLFQELDD